MSEKPILVQALDDAADQLKVDAAKIINHSLSKGQERESLLLERYLIPFMPRSVSLINGGEVVDSAGNVSSETDILIVDPQASPLYSGKYKIVPIESVFGMIEVKTKLDADELKDSLDKIRKLKQMVRTAYLPTSGDITPQFNRNGKIYDHFPPLGHVFGYTSISLKKLAEHLQVLQKEVPSNERIDGVFVLDKGEIFYMRPDGSFNPICEDSKANVCIVESGNPLIPLSLMLQSNYAQASSTGVRIHAYLGGTQWGTMIQQIGPHID